jgi:hypothetical protein
LSNLTSARSAWVKAHRPPRGSARHCDYRVVGSLADRDGETGLADGEASDATIVSPAIPKTVMPNPSRACSAHMFIGFHPLRPGARRGRARGPGTYSPEPVSRRPARTGRPAFRGVRWRMHPRCAAPQVLRGLCGDDRPRRRLHLRVRVQPSVLATPRPAARPLPPARADGLN